MCIRDRVCGQHSLDVAKTYCNMANVYESQGLFERALEFYQKDLDITVNILGQDCRRVADTKYNIADLHEGQGNLEAARELFLESAEIYAAVLGPEHDETLDARRRAETVG